MLDTQVKNQLIKIVGVDRYLDRLEEITCYAYDAFVEEALPDAVIFPKTTAEVS
ncbi:MAG: FAD-binding oxidoreductase, partial [Deltaproteobacteria bacterium]|nr:FAD-binding oxidoreductase [Candidatus Desulfobacula maris]